MGSLPQGKVNDGIQALYALKTGVDDWESSWGWNEKGKKIKKGEKGFPVWGTPRKFTKKAKAGEEEDKSFNSFPIAHIFHIGQVEEMSEKHVEFFAKKQAKAKENREKREKKEAGNPKEATPAPEVIPAPLLIEAPKKESGPLLDENGAFDIPCHVEATPSNPELRGEASKGILVELPSEATFETLPFTHDKKKVTIIELPPLSFLDRRHLEIVTRKGNKSIKTSCQCVKVTEQGFQVFTQTMFCPDPLTDDFEEILGETPCGRYTQKAAETEHAKHVNGRLAFELVEKAVEHYYAQESAKLALV